MFKSYFMAGFECATGYNAKRCWIDQVVATQHDTLVELDYQLLASAGLRTAREAMRWPLIERRGRYDFSSVAPIVRAAERHGVELLWDLFHYGYPDDVDLFGDEFPERFAEYCRAAVLYASRYLPSPYYFTPVNEASYFSWAGAEVGRFGPHQIGRGGELKLALARAALRAISAIREVCPGARMLTIDPICHVVCRPDASDRELEAAHHFNHDVVFEYMDMMCGRRNPELGGHPEALDLVGINYYWTNQWQLGADTTPLAPDDPRRLPLGALVRRAYERYGHDVVITETSELEGARGGWVDELARTACELADHGVPLRGICLYPILGMPEWHERGVWTRMGLWDLRERDGMLERVPFAPMHEALARALRLLEERSGVAGALGVAERRVEIWARDLQRHSPR
jgi:hypothetical protein